MAGEAAGTSEWRERPRGQGKKKNVVRFDAKTRSFYQDRLGTNLGKNSKKVPFVL
jgi:hypothetical protein